MKRDNTLSPPSAELPENMKIFDLDLEEGNPILCTPTGERWRIVSVDADKVSFEKLP